MSKRRRCRFCGFGLPPAAKPGYRFHVPLEDREIRPEDAPGTGDMNCSGGGHRFGIIDFLDGHANGWGARAIGERLKQYESDLDEPDCDDACRKWNEEEIEVHLDYADKLAESVERKIAWCDVNERLAPFNARALRVRLERLRDGILGYRERQAARGHRRREEKKPATSWVFPITVKPKPECSDSVLGARIAQAREMLDAASEMAAKAYRDRYHNQSYFRKLMLAGQALKRLDLEASDCAKWGHPPSPEITEERKRLAERIESLRREMRVLEGLRPQRRRR